MEHGGYNKHCGLWQLAQNPHCLNDNLKTLSHEQKDLDCTQSQSYTFTHVVSTFVVIGLRSDGAESE